ncbi:hypothetical protein FPV67DRAFT_442772 [Lyophyllum atratum]|nr:hypothetical protein FPV67DRAFT_442772 [Lyophyllum atratum]
MDDDGDGRVRLEVEDKDERLRRLQTTLEKLNAAPSSSSASVSSSPPNFTFLNRDPQRSKPFHVPPPTDLLSRVHAFLPALEASNTLLEQRVLQDPESVDIENVDVSMGQYIEMNLGLGIFETRNKDAAMSSSSTSSSFTSSSSGFSDSTSDSDPSDDSDSDSDVEIVTSFNPIRPTKPLPRRSRPCHRPQIVVLSQSHSESSDQGMEDEGG